MAAEGTALGEIFPAGVEDALEEEFRKLEGRPELTPPECDQDMSRIKGGLLEVYNDLHKNHPEIVEELRNAKG